MVNDHHSQKIKSGAEKLFYIIANDHHSLTMKDGAEKLFYMPW
jgi:hypothetical protein